MPKQSACPCVFAALMCFILTTAFAQEASSKDLTTLSMEDLMNVEVVTASKKPERYFDTAAAVYVITADDIHRSGYTNVPDLLRMVPGISVQRVNAHAWDISARGFNASVFANKMLVLIDGRAVYTPLYGGVWWDAQDVVLEDVERIEVVRGPGGTVWGANAVNGVINIITKKARDTQGTLLVAGGGTEERDFGTVRYGGHSKDGWYYRAFAKYFDRDEGYRPNGTANDEWAMGHTGFRAEKDKWTLQGDFYKSQLGQRYNVVSFAPPGNTVMDKPIYVQGGNILGRYEDEDWSLQTYWDNTNRDLQILNEQRNTFDTEYNRRFSLAPNQEINWGAGYRVQIEDMRNTDSVFIEHSDHLDQLFSVFAQDEIKFMDDKLKFIVGSKMEHNIYTGFEFEPNVRTSYDIDDHSMVWAAASRAVRTPSRLDESGFVTSYSTTSGFSRTAPNTDLSSEKLDAYEVGYRNQVRENILVDLTGFVNHYKDLITYNIGNTITDRGQSVLLFPTVNGIDGNVEGVELATDVKIREWWKIKTAYTFTKMTLSTHAEISNLGLESALEEAVPRHVAYIRSSFDLPKDILMDVTLKYSDSITSGRVPSLVDVDINLIKTLGHGWEIAINGQNLLRPHSRESVLTTSTQLERAVFGKITRRF